MSQALGIYTNVVIGAYLVVGVQVCSWGGAANAKP